MRLNRYWFNEAKRCLNMAWKHRDQTTWVFCPCCKQDLCSTDSFVSDKGRGDKNKVTYKCDRCGEVSYWNFDVMPGGAYFLGSKRE